METLLELTPTILAFITTLLILALIRRNRKKIDLLMMTVALLIRDVEELNGEDNKGE